MWPAAARLRFPVSGGGENRRSESQTGEGFVTLDGVKRVLDEEMLMICDGVKPVALAGVMGGLNSEIREDTKVVLLESAYFSPAGTGGPRRSWASKRRRHIGSEGGSTTWGASLPQTEPPS